MKYQTIKQIFAATVTFVVFSSSVAFAKVDDRTTEKQEEK